MLLNILLALTLPLMATNTSIPLIKEEYKVVPQQGQGILFIDKLPSSEAYATAGKGSSTPEGYDDSTEAREARSQKHYTAYIEVVGVKKIKITQQEPVIIKGLSTAKKYLLKVYAADGKTSVTSFPFSFKTKGANKLRLSYHPFYSSWRLDVMKK